jgi:hypothetical protein
VTVAGAAVLLFAPLALHVVTSAVAVLGATRSRRAYGATLSAAIVLHFLYDYFVVVVLLA